MKERKLALIVLYVLVVCSTVTWSVRAQNGAPNIRSIAVVVYDADFGQVLLGKNPHQRRSIASLTKVMTILYASELVQAGKINLSDKVKASANAASRNGTQIDLRSGDVFTVEELLYSTALVSANDAAVALAEFIGGSESAFAKLMTERAVSLGLTNTNFVDSTGLLSINHGNYSTAYEMALLSQIAMDNQLFHHFVSTKEYELKSQNRTIRNTNVLLQDNPIVNGIKTGATTPAGNCLITSAVDHDRRAIIVVLGAPTREQRNKESEELLAWVYNSLQVILSEDQVVTQVVVRDGHTQTVNAIPAREVSVFAVDEDTAKVTTKVDLIKDLRAPIQPGQKLGEIVILRDGEEYGRVDLVAREGTGLASFVRRLYNRIVEFFTSLF